MPRFRLLVVSLLAVLSLGILFWRWLDAPTPPPQSSQALADPAALSSQTAMHDTPNPAHAAREQELRELIRDRLRQALQSGESRPHEAVLTFANADAYRRFLARVQALGLTVLGQLDALRTVRIRYDTLDALSDDLFAHPGDYHHAGPNFLVQPPDLFARVPRAAGQPVPFGNSALAFLGAGTDRASWGRGVTVAVLDSGVAPDPTFNSGQIQYLNIGLGTLPATDAGAGHGTSVAALVAGRDPAAPGVAPAAAVLSVRVTDDGGTADTFTVAQAMIAAVDAGADILNLSLGSRSSSTVLTAAIDYALEHGSVVVAAAGNDQAAHLAWPAADSRVISVGAVDAHAEQVAFSNSGPQLQITAPGYGVQTAWLDGQRLTVNGTSASAPLVSGAIAAVLSQNPALTATQAWDVVRTTTSDGGAPGADADYGNGVLNLDWAMNASNAAHVDPAIASHHYDSAGGRMEFVVQNRSTRSVAGLRLDTELNGVTTSQNLPTLAAGASHVVTVPVDQATRAANHGLIYTTTLVTPLGLADANVANNQRASFLAPPVSLEP